MTRWRPLVLVAVVAVAGALGALAIGAAVGMGSGDLARIALLLVPAALVTVVSTAVARPLLARSSIGARLLVIAVVATVVCLVNLGVLAQFMFVSNHDATVVGMLLVYSMGAGMGAAVALARASSTAVDRLVMTARSLGEGQLEARVGSLNAGAELDALGRTLDEMAERLQQATARERELESARRDLVTAVSHDLRTPLASLRAMIEAVHEGIVGDPPTLRRYVAEMRRAIESLTVLVDDLFELVQLDAGAIEAETRRAKVDDVVRSALAACRTQAVQKGLVVRTRLSGTEGSLCSPRMVRVVQSLVQNAIRHTPSDGTVTIEASEGPRGLELTVEDTGEGIAPEVLERVFEPFWRGDPARAGPGSGLGLAVAKRIVDRLGGRIDAQSEPARGSRFAVLVPSTPASPVGAPHMGADPK